MPTSVTIASSGHDRQPDERAEAGRDRPADVAPAVARAASAARGASHSSSSPSSSVETVTASQIAMDGEEDARSGEPDFARPPPGAPRRHAPPGDRRLLVRVDRCRRRPAPPGRVRSVGDRDHVAVDVARDRHARLCRSRRSRRPRLSPATLTSPSITATVSTCSPRCHVHVPGDHDVGRRRRGNRPPGPRPGASAALTRRRRRATGSPSGSPAPPSGSRAGSPGSICNLELAGLELAGDARLDLRLVRRRLALKHAGRAAAGTGGTASASGSRAPAPGRRSRPPRRARSRPSTRLQPALRCPWSSEYGHEAQRERERASATSTPYR